jgi:hypothetical protein
MAQKIRNTIWIDSLHLCEVYGANYIPSELCYMEQNSTPFLSHELSLEEKQNRLINRRFKIELGNIKPGSLDRKKHETECGTSLSAYEMTKDYFNKVLSDIEIELKQNINDSGTFPAKILVAEPLAFQVEDHD